MQNRCPQDLHLGRTSFETSLALQDEEWRFR